MPAVYSQFAALVRAYAVCKLRRRRELIPEVLLPFVYIGVLVVIARTSPLADLPALPRGDPVDPNAAASLGARSALAYAPRNSTAAAGMAARLVSRAGSPLAGWSLVAADDGAQVDEWCARGARECPDAAVVFEVSAATGAVAGATVRVRGPSTSSGAADEQACRGGSPYASSAALPLIGALHEAHAAAGLRNATLVAGDVVRMAMPAYAPVVQRRAFASTAGMYMSVAFWPFVSGLVTAVVIEKERGLRYLMRAMGLREVARTLAWLVLYGAIGLAATLLMALVSVAGGVFGAGAFAALWCLLLAYAASAVGYSLCMTPFFKTAKAASTCCVLISIAASCAAFPLVLLDATAGVKWAFCLVSPIALALGVAEIAEMDRLGSIGLWTSTSTANFSLGSCLVMLLVDTLVYAALATLLVVQRRAFASTAGMYMSVAFWPFVSGLVTAVVIEKERGLRYLMRAMGLREVARTLAWLVLYGAIGLAATLLMALVSVAGGVFGAGAFAALWCLLLAYAASAVGYSLCMTPFFQTAKAASTCCVLVSIAASCAAFPLVLLDATAGVKWAFCLVSPIALALGVAEIAEMDRLGSIGLWTSTSTANFSLGSCLVMLLVDTLVYAALATLLGSVVEVDAFCRKRAKAVDPDDLASVSSDDIELLPGGSKVGVSLVDVVKVFPAPNGVAYALRGVSLDICEGEVFGLLGHNGAGKTTLVSILAGLATATSGDVNVCRGSLGVCPQQNVLFDELNAVEHARLFCGIKGIPTNRMDDEVFSVLYDPRLVHILPSVWNMGIVSALRSTGVDASPLAISLQSLASASTFNSGAYAIPGVVALAIATVAPVLAIEIVRYKEKNVRQQLKVAGLDHRAYWLGCLMHDSLVMSPVVITTVVLLAFVEIKGLTVRGAMSIQTILQLLVAVPYFTMASVGQFASPMASRILHYAFAVIDPAYTLPGALYFIASTPSRMSSLLVSPAGPTLLIMVAQLAVCWFLLCWIEKPRRSAKADTGDSERQFLLSEEGAGNVNADVRDERTRLVSDHNDVVQFRGLRKTFDAPASSEGEDPEQQRSAKLRCPCLKRSGPQLVAVDDLWIGVPRGECFGLLGPNGAGKTTTLSLLTGQAEPTSGSATIAGKSVSEDPAAALRDMGYCPQFDALLDDLSVRENLEFYAAVKGIPRSARDARVQALIHALDIEEHADKPAKNVSGGTKRKASFCNAVAAGPALLVLDEPSTGLDPVARRHMWDAVDTARAASSVLLTTHSMDEAETLCHRIGVLVRGRLRCLGTPQQLKERFGNTYCLQATVRDGAAFGELMQRLFPGVAWQPEAGRVAAQIPTVGVSVSSVFAALEGLKQSGAVAEYSFSQTSLAQAFISVVKENS
eukprot:m51a1_g1088 putative atp-binding cassette sub-family a member 5 (1369) ;mRNA; r:51425-56735